MNHTFSYCLLGDHDFKVITRNHVTENIDGEEVVRWCKVCGSVTVDLDVDNQTKKGHYMPLRTCEVVKTRTFN